MLIWFFLGCLVKLLTQKGRVDESKNSKNITKQIWPDKLFAKENESIGTERVMKAHDCSESQNCVVLHINYVNCLSFAGCLQSEVLIV